MSNTKAAKELHDTLKKLFAKDAAVFPAIVKSVDKVACTCDVEFDELEIGDVRLKATNEDKPGFKIFPKEQSVVLIERIEEGQFVVQMMSEIDEVKIENDDLLFQMTDGFKFSKGEETLLKIMLDLCKANRLERHQTKSGPTLTLTTVSLNRYTAIENRLENLLK